MSDLGKPRLETRYGDRPPADGRDERSLAGLKGNAASGAPPGASQPLTPPTVIPSMKKRWAKRNSTTTGKTISVEAAMSRL
jgi:hypothetical protein